MARAALQLPDAPLNFPNPETFDDEGLIVIGGDLRPERLLAAYASGIFPWYSEGYPPLWWCPNPRAVLLPENLHISRSMRRRLKQRDFRVTWNHAFGEILRGCADRGAEGTWLLPEMQDAYLELHGLGFAHSLEVWRDDRLIGGLYGVACGALFAAESMFHRETDASKIALILACHSLYAAGIQLFDVQFLTPHLSSLGAVEIPRSEYLSRLATAQKQQVSLIELDLNFPV